MATRSVCPKQHVLQLTQRQTSRVKSKIISNLTNLVHKVIEQKLVTPAAIQEQTVAKQLCPRVPTALSNLASAGEFISSPLFCCGIVRFV